MVRSYRVFVWFTGTRLFIFMFHPIWRPRYKKRQVSVRAIQPVEKNGPLKDSCSGDIRLAWRCAFHAPFENTVVVHIAST